MKIAIHQDSGSFSDRWISFCEKESIPYKIVNCYDNDIISQLNDCDGLMWHWVLNDYKAELFARQLLLSLEKKGINIFPNVNASWHYNDKLGQKYLLESIEAPLVKSYVFYTKAEALEWIENTTFPKVFKLRGGAGSVNVSLVKTKARARYLVRKAFGQGFSHINRINRLKNRIGDFKIKRNSSTFIKVLAGFARILIPNESERFSHNEIGYIYFQDFIRDNESDTRLVVIGNRCFGVRRFCRKGDFRASGSGLWDPNPEYINMESVKIAFNVAKNIGSQSTAFDFVLDGQDPRIVEISYCFPKGAPDCCLGYWDEKLNWHEEKVNAEEYMIKDFLEGCSSKNILKREIQHMVAYS